MRPGRRLRDRSPTTSSVGRGLNEMIEVYLGGADGPMIDAASRALAGSEQILGSP